MTTKKSWGSVNWKFHGFWVAADFGHRRTPNQAKAAEWRLAKPNRARFLSFDLGWNDEKLRVGAHLFTATPSRSLALHRRDGWVAAAGFGRLLAKSVKLENARLSPAQSITGASSRRDDRWYSAFVYGLVNVFRFIISPPGALGG